MNSDRIHCNFELKRKEKNQLTLQINFTFRLLNL
jgi:hypothetical protein